MDVASQWDGSDRSSKVAEEVGVVGLGLVNQLLVFETLLYFRDLPEMRNESTNPTMRI